MSVVASFGKDERWRTESIPLLGHSAISRVAFSESGMDLSERAGFFSGVCARRTESDFDSPFLSRQKRSGRRPFPFLYAYRLQCSGMPSSLSAGMNVLLYITVISVTSYGIGGFLNLCGWVGGWTINLSRRLRRNASPKRNGMRRVASCSVVKCLQFAHKTVTPTSVTEMCTV